MSELMPCPFQKEGETHDVRFVELKPGYGQIGCADCEFWFPSDDMLTFEEAKARWNTRHERTCRPITYIDIWIANNIPRWVAECKCGAALGEGRSKQDMLAALPPYCSYCGAKMAI